MCSSKIQWQHCKCQNAQNLCITGFLFSCEWSHPAADTLLWLLQCHLMKLLECAHTICGVKFDGHTFFCCNPCTGLDRRLGFAGGWGCQISRQSPHEGGKVVSPKNWPPLPSRRYSWYSFLLEAELTPGPKCGWKDYANKIFQWYHQESNPWPSCLQLGASNNCTTANLNKHTLLDLHLPALSMVWAFATRTVLHNIWTAQQ